MQIDEREIDEAVDDQHPHHGEMPVARAGEPAAEGQRSRESALLERIAAERFALPRERRIRVEDAQPAADHDRQRDAFTQWVIRTTA